MVQWVLKENGNVIPRRLIRPLRVDELHSDIEIKKRETFDTLIERRHDTSTTPSNVSPSDPKEDDGGGLDAWLVYHDDIGSDQTYPLMTLSTPMVSFYVSSQYMID